MDKNTYHNPVNRGLFPDPSIVRVGDDYFMVNSSFQYFPALPISHSKDMVNWRIVGHGITDSSYIDLSEITDSYGFWAPDISYHDGRFYIFATFRFNNGGEDGNRPVLKQIMISSEKGQGPYTKPVWFDVSSIDPSLFVDIDENGNEQKYMITSPAARAFPLSDDCAKLTGEPVNVWEGMGEGYAEGPHILKKDGWYYAMVSEGGTGYKHRINAARSRTLFGEYEPSPYNPIMHQADPDGAIQRAGHGKLVKDQNGSWWLYYLCGRPNGGRFTTIGRETAMDPVRWTDDGWFVVNEGKGPSTEQNAPDLPRQAAADNNFDDFDSDVPGLNWEFVRNPDYNSFSMTERRGFARILTGNGQLFELHSKNTLLRREKELSFTAETMLEFLPEKNGEQAGMTCYYSTDCYIRFSLCHENGRKLQLVINRNRGEELIAEAENIEEQPVYLKAEVQGLCRKFFFSYDRIEWVYAGAVEQCVFLCDEGVPEKRNRHTGTLTGIYANNGGSGRRIPADFDFFQITHP